MLYIPLVATAGDAEFTGNAICYPDGLEIQRRGVKIDRHIATGMNDLVQIEDVLINEALKIKQCQAY